MTTPRNRTSDRRPSTSRSPGQRPSAGRSGSRPSSGPSRGRIRTRRFVALGIVLAVLLVIIAVFFTPLFSVGSVEVRGNSRVSTELVRQTAKLQPGASMFGVDTDKVAERVVGLAPVRSAEVSRSWPSTVDIEITERTPVAWSRGADGSVRLVDERGVFFASAPKPPKGAVELRLGQAGERDPKVTAALGVAGKLSPGLRKRTAAVGANSPDDIQLFLSDGKRVNWGGDEQNDRKNKVLAALLSRKGKVYDVASPDMPTVREH